MTWASLSCALNASIWPQLFLDQPGLAGQKHVVYRRDNLQPAQLQPIDILDLVDPFARCLDRPRRELVYYKPAPRRSIPAGPSPERPGLPAAAISLFSSHHLLFWPLPCDERGGNWYIGRVVSPFRP
jgi:hypothetical protein